MRIIAGEKRGLKLFTLDGLNTRPTLDRVKETVFNVINFDIMGKNCLDVFSGSGNLSLEALSRGATSAYLIEKDKEAFDIVKKNIEKANYQSKSTLFNLDFKDALLKISKLDVKFSIVFIDPPYESDFYDETLDLLVKYDLLNEDAIIICEHKKGHVFENDHLFLHKEKSFSKNAVSFLKVKE